jgi:NTE family protein
MQKKTSHPGADAHTGAVRAPADLADRFGCVALLLQGGGALGAYQAGVYEALAEAGIHPTWTAGVSIGAVNAAIIAGNAPEHRVERLRKFWNDLTASPWGVPLEWQSAVAQGDMMRTIVNQMSSAFTATAGTPGFFKPRVPPPWLEAPGKIEATSYYDTAALRSTLEQLIDFDRINAKDTYLSVGAVNVRSGNFFYFTPDNHTIGPEHIMASGALPPGFPAIEIEGEFYWDGGLVSNTPLQWIFENGPPHDTLAFQVDLWSARGRFPRTMQEVATRQKEIQYSSRTRAGTTWLKDRQKLRRAIEELLPQLPPELKDSPAGRILDAEKDSHIYNIVHLIYRPQTYEGETKDFEFSRLTMEEHWRAGYNDARRTMRHREIFDRPLEGVFTFDVATDGRE